MAGAVENAVMQVEPSRRDEACARAIGVILWFRPRMSPSLFSSAEHAEIERLQNNSTIVVLPADKGNSTVLLGSTEYHSEMMALLSVPTPQEGPHTEAATRLSNASL